LKNGRPAQQQQQQLLLLASSASSMRANSTECHTLALNRDSTQSIMAEPARWMCQHSCHCSGKMHCASAHSTCFRHCCCAYACCRVPTQR
jgi:hypothetical protein